LNRKQKYSTVLFFLFCFFGFSQEITLKGKILDLENRGIHNASVSILDESDDIFDYSITAEDGSYNITFEKPKSNDIKIEISCLGYQKISKIISLLNLNQDFQLEEKIEELKEVVVEFEKKIRTAQDTTFIKVASFGNKTEQTVEDVLKKLPGIEVLNDGTIKAHGKTIDKLLIEGEDMFDKNYKVLSKNLDAKYLDEVQIIDNFEDNLVFKKLNNSDKVAINLKLKKGLTNVWFGNVMLGSGIVSENRWNESLNLGLLKKKIKFFYFGQYNNLGVKASDLISANVNQRESFGSDRYEYKSKSLYNINNSEINFFSNSQTIFNNAFLNSLSFNSKIKNNLSLRGVIFHANDNQNQNSSSFTNYNLENNLISFTEENFYNNKKTLASAELEFKYTPNEKSYISNLTIFKNNPNNIINNLLFNEEQINQSSTVDNFTFYNHFNYTRQISENIILNNYLYIGNDKMNEKSNVQSPFLNDFLSLNSNEIIIQNANNKIFYVGYKSKLISKFNKLDLTNSVQFEYNKEQFNNIFTVENQNFPAYQNNSNLKLFNFIQENTLRYNFSNKFDVTANLNWQQSLFKSNFFSENIFLLNPAFYFNIKRTGFGNFSLSFAENSLLPEINQLTSNFQLTDYRSFFQGNADQKPVKNQTTSFNYNYYNDANRFSINTGLSYVNSKLILNTVSNLTNELNFNAFIQTRGGESYNFNFGIVKYSRKIKLASKIGTNISWITAPVNVNSTKFLNSTNSINTVKYSGTTYFKAKMNFDFGFSYNYFQSNFQDLKTNNTTKDAFLNSHSLKTHFLSF
jgi:hypothetical protein